MKLLKMLSLSLGLLTCFTAQANQSSDELCYPLAHGENGLGSRNSMFLPTLITEATGWNAYIYITNTSYKPVNVRLDFLNYNASPYEPHTVTYFGQFSASNSPIDTSGVPALLGPHQTGFIRIFDDNVSQNIGFTGKVQWQADACIDKALRVDVRNAYLNGNRYSQGFVMLNGGNSF